MNLLKTCILGTILIVSVAQVNGKVVQPAYFIFGEQQFKGAQIYDIIQDNNLNFWFSTNEGLVFYDHYTFKKVTCTDSRSLSYFNFVKNQDGDIFCTNLNNQIFKLQHESCELVYTMNQVDSRSDLRLILTPQNELLLAGKNLVLLDNQGKEKAKFSGLSSFIGLPFLNDDGKIFISNLFSDSVLVFENSQLICEPLIYLDSKTPGLGVLYFFKVENQTYAINNATKTCYKFDPLNLTLSKTETPEIFNRSESVRFYHESDYTWVAGTLPGIFQLNSMLSSHSLTPYYHDFFISDVYTDHEGNTLFATFDKGILVVPDLLVEDAFQQFKDDHVTCIEYIEGRGVLVGTAKGQIALYNNGQFDFIHTDGKRPIEVIVGKKGIDYFIFDDGLIRLYDFKSGKISDLLVASLKDGSFDKNGNAYLATNIGLAEIQFIDNKPQYHLVEDLNFRNYSVEYDSINDRLFIATANGLFGMADDSVFSISSAGQQIFSSYMKWGENKLFASLTTGGMIVIEQDNSIHTLDFNYNHVSQVIYRFEIYNGKIFALTEGGILAFNLEGKFIEKTENITGEKMTRVTDFILLHDTIWVSNSDGLLKRGFKAQNDQVTVPPISISKVLVNDVRVDTNENRNYSAAQRKFTFVLHCPTIRHKDAILYQYRLIGYDTTWSVQNYEQNEIVYNALAAGKYEFQVMTNLNGQVSDLVSWHFTIAAPFYATSGFILSAVIIFILLVYMIYRSQLQSLRKKSRQEKELYASKLTAIRSQMNPHFIFNSLNSIQDLVLKGDVENSYSYITTFSNLVRRTLNYSDKEFIDFDQEIKLLELYLSLEKLRFKNDFTYELNIGEISDIALPPMLIQPFIENALIHGLLHKNGNKKISISFHLNDDLICTVEDNGIGRAKAKEIKSRKTNQFESFSLKAIEKRFEILNTTQQTHGGFTYIDLIENGEVKGTRVVISIPYKRRF